MTLDYPNSIVKKQQANSFRIEPAENVAFLYIGSTSTSQQTAGLIWEEFVETTSAAALTAGILAILTYIS